MVGLTRGTGAGILAGSHGGVGGLSGMAGHDGDYNYLGILLIMN